MWQFIISGYVPGTDVQVTFGVIAVFTSTFLGTLSFLGILRRHKTLRADIALIMARLDYFKEISL